MTGTSMKVAHLCLSNYYMDDRAYQENELIEEHARQGHQVLVIASTQVLNTERQREFVAPGRYRNDHGVDVVRLPYHPALPHRLAKSLRVHRGVYQLLEAFAPDAILFHGMCGWELLTVRRYKQAHPEVKFYVDTHTDFINSARGPVSKWGLHYLYYRPIVHRCLNAIDRVLYISALTGRFARDFYGVPDSKLEFYPLGGHPVPDDEYRRLRETIRADLAVPAHGTLFVQSGKQASHKKILEALRAFAEVPDPDFRLVIAGSLLEEVREEAEALIQVDPRVRFLGWQSPAQLKALLCAADVYLQPGSQSSTMQTSLCCRCALILEDMEGHEIYTDGTGWRVTDQAGIVAALQEIQSGAADLDAMKGRAEALARNKLDYAVLARRILH
ncbi:MAG: glycosyltransferase family 4 protein [Alcanivorax sp.]|nr:glycosyltransferase family 4 protein [Alcanivorax sp.]